MKQINRTSLVVDLDRLVIDERINPRRSITNVADIKAQIKEHGFTEPVWVRSVTGLDPFEKLAVIDGRRRVQAMTELALEGFFAGETPTIDVLAFDCTIEEAAELALATFVVREGLSPADEAEAFYRLKLSGLDEAEIAARFAKSEKLVRQRIAIGSLAPEILQALREDKITIQAAQAFTLTPSHDRQLEIFNSGAFLHPRNIHSAIKAGTVESDDHRAIFVGLDAYEAAGGHVARDLFSETALLGDEALLQQLADDKLAAEVKRLKDEGWSFVDVLSEAKRHTWWNYSTEQPKGKRSLSAEESARLKWCRDEAEKAEAQIEESEFGDDDAEIRLGELQDEIEALTTPPYTKKQMAELGVVISAYYDFKFGVARPGAKAEPGEDGEGGGQAHASSIPPGPDAPARDSVDYSDAVNQLLAVAAHKAVILAMVQDKPAITARLGLAARTHAALGGYNAFAVPERPSAFGGAYDAARDAFFKAHFYGSEGTKLESLLAILTVLETLPPEDILQLEAFLAADHFEMDSINNADAREIFNLIDPVVRGVGLEIDEAFLQRLSRAQLASIAAEVDPASPAPKGKRPDMVAALLPRLGETGWLPAPLRGPSYEGPGSAAYAEKLAEAAMPAAPHESAAASIMTLQPSEEEQAA